MKEYETTEEHVAWDNGYMCHQSAQNPHPKESKLHKAWQDGFDESIRVNAADMDPVWMIAHGYEHLLPTE